MRILLTGGCGYIGSHTALAVVAAGHEPILLDNFRNSTPDVAVRISALAGRTLAVVSGDVHDVALVRSVLVNQNIDAVIHFAALKSVADSVGDPLSYYSNNVGGLLATLEAMNAVGVRQIIFSGSAAVYGDPQSLPVSEDHPLGALSPYGRSKLMCEEILSDLVRAQHGWRVSLLRYFNPAGAHPSGLIGEDPSGVPTNLMPLVARAARTPAEVLKIFGTDYATDDGTAVRDYVHVMDLAEGHVAALNALSNGDPLQIYNLGTGRGTSVLELVDAFQRVNDVIISVVSADRRVGDVAASYAAVGKAARDLGWRATRTLPDMCADCWRFGRNAIGRL